MTFEQKGGTLLQKKDGNLELLTHSRTHLLNNLPSLHNLRIQESCQV